MEPNRTSSRPIEGLQMTLVTDDQQFATVDLWVIRMPPDYRIDDAQGKWLDDAERHRAASFHGLHDRGSYVAAHVWLRKILAAALTVGPRDLLFAVDARGKPAVRTAVGAAPRPVHFALSHTPNGMVCAVSNQCEVGVDIARIAPIPNLAAVAVHMLHPHEIRRFQATQEHERLWRFYRLWTAKESLLKAIGTDLDIPPSSLAFTEAPDGEWQLSDYARERIGKVRSSTYIGHTASGAEIDSFDYIFAVTALAPAVTLTIHEITCGASTADSYLKGCRSFNSTIGAARDAAIH
jgi:phosphopantetheine--protein transferase-like protein